MRYLRWRLITATLDVSPLAGRRFRLRRGGDVRRWTAPGSTPPSSEGLFVVPYWGLPR